MSPEHYQPRVQFIQHAGKEILVVDFRGGDREVFQSMLQDFHRLLKDKAPASVRMMGLWGGASGYFPETTLRWRGAMLTEKDKVLRSAQVGFTGIAKVAMQGYIALVALLGNPLGKDRAVVFDKVEEALDWLAK